MPDFWTLMVITILGGPMDGTITGLAYPNEQSCIKNINQVTDTLTYDYKVECLVTQVPATPPIRPKRRPVQ